MRREREKWCEVRKRCGERRGKERKKRKMEIREMGIYRVFGSCKTCFTRKPSLVVELGNTANKNLLTSKLTI